MAHKTNDELKEKFEQGDYPNEQDFIDFIDSKLSSLIEDGQELQNSIAETIIDSDGNITLNPGTSLYNKNGDVIINENGTVNIESVLPPLAGNALKALRVKNDETNVEFAQLPDAKLKITTYDTTEGYLSDKLVTSTNIALGIHNLGGNETLAIAALDEKIRITNTDTTSDKLINKLVTSTGIVLAIENLGGNERIKLSSPNAGTDERTKVSVADTTSSYLSNKIIASTGIILHVGNLGGDEKLVISSITDGTSVKVSNTDTSTGYLSQKLISSTGIILEQVNVGGYEQLKISSLGASSDGKVYVSSTDIITGYLANKLIASTGVVVTHNNIGGNEYISIGSSASVDIAGLTIYVDGSRADSYIEDGTEVRPYKTISAAVSVITTTRNRIFIRPAVYTENISIATPLVGLSSIIIQGTHPNSCIVNGSLDMFPPDGWNFKLDVSNLTFNTTTTTAVTVQVLGSETLYLSCQNCNFISSSSYAAQFHAGSGTGSILTYFDNCRLLSENAAHTDGAILFAGPQVNFYVNNTIYGLTKNATSVGAADFRVDTGTTTYIDSDNRSLQYRGNYVNGGTFAYLAVTGRNTSKIDLSNQDVVLIRDSQNDWLQKEMAVSDFKRSNVLVVENTSGAQYLDAVTDVVICKDTLTTVSIVVPTAVGAKGKIYDIKNTSSVSSIDVVLTGVETIDGESLITLYKNDSITIVSDNANWYII